MKNLKLWLPAVAAVFLCGCFQVEDELTIEKDGSGAVNLTVSSRLPQETVENLGMMGSGFGSGNGPAYPPINEMEARHFFPAKDFTVKTERKAAEGNGSLQITARFKDINALLASPYARAHQLALNTNANGALSLRALSGGSAFALGSSAMESEEQFAQIPGLEDARKNKDKLRFMFRVTLPNTITAANGTNDKESATWVVERARCKTDDEFAAQLARVYEATCSSAGITFSPVTPPRLGLSSFNELQEGKAASSAALPDTNKVAAAARFVPYSLQVTRSVDISGEGAQPSQAVLNGAVVIPPELAPQQWGTTKLIEAVDSKGNSLMPKQDEDGSMAGFRSFSDHFDRQEMPESDSEESPAAKAPREKLRMITLQMKAPDWKIKQIARIKASMDLQYLGGAEVLKLTNAVPAAMVMDMSKPGSLMNFSSDSDRGQVSDPRLSAMGLSLRVESAMVQSGMTMLSLETGGGKSALVDAQVFDAEGRPWPTTINASDSAQESRSCQVIVAGKPKPPFSLAVAVGGVGASVSVPIILENVPVGDK